MINVCNERNFRNNVSEVIFVPYAKVNKDYDGYTKMMADAIANLGNIYYNTNKFVELKKKFQ